MIYVQKSRVRELLKYILVIQIKKTNNEPTASNYKSARY
jgi:hypothetical protein